MNICKVNIAKYIFLLFFFQKICICQKKPVTLRHHLKNKIMGRHYSEEARSHTMVLTCCCCHDEWIVTPEEFVFNKCGRKIFDKSTYKGIPIDSNHDGWCCEKCAEEILRIKNL